ncbi:MAG TPA: hypothetical protein PLI96_00860 [Halothiobacillus sp.]|nr:hypothetical protein [Halothiobacillus sp.]
MDCKIRLLLPALTLVLTTMTLTGCNSDSSTPTSADVTPPLTSAIHSYTIGGKATGFVSSTQLTLQNNEGDDLTLTTEGSFIFPEKIATGASYNVTIKTQPTDGSLFGITYGSGTVGSNPVTSVTLSPINLSVLHSFAGDVTDGSGPSGSLIQGTDGNFYGMTQGGGLNNAGTVFKINSSGVESVLHSFAFSTAEGNTPNGSLIQGTDGNFYGMTQQGGLQYSGTVFKITPSGAKTTLYSFLNSSTDGGRPTGNLIQGTNGVFYGMTQQGGYSSNGTVFTITSDGVEMPLHLFTGSPSDGSGPTGSLIQGTDGNFYGMTYQGGANNVGIVFKINPSGVETVLHSFEKSTADGSYPVGSLIQGKEGNFYGMTVYGGGFGNGVVFKITPDGVKTVLHSFTGSTTAPVDGSTPHGSLIQGKDGNFYGTTQQGGVNNAGTVFMMTPGGAVTVLHSFNNADGSAPDGSLVQGTDGYFYGMTYAGGASGNGTVFKIN